jgi:PTH1 family peptidyl-tRNA hydrolase
MKLIVGLGNPGKRYENTKHNMGFTFIDNFAKDLDVKINNKKFNGLYTKTNYKGESVVLLKPQKYINLSGEVVRDFVNFFKISNEDILIISDDLDLHLGKFRLRPRGTSGGHNGLKDIEKNLATTEYKRLKVGISKGQVFDTIDYVLSKNIEEDKLIIDKLIPTINNLLEDYFELEFEDLMSKYNNN